MSVAGAKLSVREDVVKYQARTTLLNLAEQIATSRKLINKDTQEQLKQATQLRVWLKSLDYSEFLTRDEKFKTIYAIIDIGDVNDLPTAPILELRTKPDIFIAGVSTTTNIVNQTSTGGGLPFSNSDVDTGTEVVDTFSRSISSGAEWQFVVRKNDGSGQFQGEIQATWKSDGSLVQFDYETGTALGTVDVEDVTFTVVHNAGNIELRATAVSDNWTVEGSRTHIPPPSSISLNNTLTDQHVVVGSSLNVATEVDTTAVGDILADETNGLTIKAGSIVNADISNSAGIAYTKLNLTGNIVNADIAAGAAIAYTKLNLTGAIVNADISSSAAIAYSKLNLSGSIVNADVNASAAIAYSKLNLSGSIVNADVNASAAIAYSKLNLADSVVNADINSSAAIAFSKLAGVSVGSILIGVGGVLAELGIGASGRVLTSNGTTASWQALPSYASISGTPSNNQIAVWTSSSAIEGDAILTFDGTNLTIGGSGTGTAADWIATSDRRLKENITPYGTVLEKVKRMKGLLSTYVRKNNTELEIGMIAQDVNEIMPELVVSDGDGMLGLRYARFGAVAIQALGELEQEVEELRKQVEVLSCR